jgi:hypothetical protein
MLNGRNSSASSRALNACIWIAVTDRPGSVMSYSMERTYVELVYDDAGSTPLKIGSSWQYRISGSRLVEENIPS